MKFQCKQCGKCCQSFKNEKGDRGLPLWEWEKEELEKLAKERGITLKIEPHDLVFDKKSGLYLCIHFILNQEPCPFLKDNKCSIYDNRPLVCKAFPLASSPMFSKEKINPFVHCENFNTSDFYKESFSMEKMDEIKVKKGEMIGAISKTFPKEIIISSTIIDTLKQFVEDTMKPLIVEKKIKLREVSKMDFSRYPATPFFEFLRKIGLCDEAGKKILIQRLTDDKLIKESLENWEKSAD